MSEDTSQTDGPDRCNHAILLLIIIQAETAVYRNYDVVME